MQQLRQHALHRRASSPRPGAAVVIVVILLAATLPSGRLSAQNPGPAPSTVPVEARLENEFVLKINAERRHQGISPLSMDETLTMLAREHSRQMALLGRLSHNLQEGGSLQNRLQSAGYRFRSARENLACAFSVGQAHSSLLSSPPHARNLLASDVTRLGVGVVRVELEGRTMLYVTQIFAQPYQP
jgi:uncharacterized protein YkwD